MIASARCAYIIERLSECGIIDYKSIAAELDVSEATVRRDFEKLEKEGRLRRVQGGAVSKEDNRFAELSIISKSKINAEEKIKVAEAAAAEIKDGECIFLDCGTSIAPLAKYLLKRNVHIVTNNNLILQFAPEDIVADVFVIGGRFCPADHMFVGPLSEAMLASFTFNRAFIGCMGLDLQKNAAYVTDMQCLAIKKMAMNNAEKTYLLIDSSKQNKHGLFRLAGYEDFDCIFIDDDGSGKEYPENFVIV